MSDYPHQWIPGHVHEWIHVLGISDDEEECWTCHRRRLTLFGKLKRSAMEMFGIYVNALETIQSKNAEIARLRAWVDEEQQQRGEAVEDNAKLTGDVEEISTEAKRLVKLMRSIRTSAWSAWSHWPGKDDSVDIKQIMEITSEFKDENTEKNAGQKSGG